MNFEIDQKKNADKDHIFAQVKEQLDNLGLRIAESDKSRPWGGFYVIDESQSADFIQKFLSDVPEANTGEYGKISPKILIVQSGKRLSWQYHHRRAEVWKVIAGEAAVVISDDDKQTPVQTKVKGDVIVLKQGQRHRLIGTDQWGIIAEIWQHTVAGQPSDEDDIVRVEDDFGR